MQTTISQEAFCLAGLVQASVLTHQPFKVSSPTTLAPQTLMANTLTASHRCSRRGWPGKAGPSLHAQPQTLQTLFPNNSIFNPPSLQTRIPQDGACLASLVQTFIFTHKITMIIHKRSAWGRSGSAWDRHGVGSNVNKTT